MIVNKVPAGVASAGRGERSVMRHRDDTARRRGSEMKAGLACVSGLLITSQLHAQSTVSIWGSDLANAYHYVDRYEIVIDASPQEVWPRLLDFGSWMYQFDMKHESGPEASEGATYRLYEGQDFFFKIVTVIPERMVVGIMCLPQLKEKHRWVSR